MIAVFIRKNSILSANVDMMLLTIIWLSYPFRLIASHCVSWRVILSHAVPCRPKSYDIRNADERDKSVARVKSGGSIDAEAVEPKTRRRSDDASDSERDGDAGIRASDAKAGDDGVCLSSGDICRICHMGRYAPVAENHSSHQDSQARDDRTSVPPSLAYLGSLISACKCRGTVALVHVECLERWLTESGRARCELCGHRYATKRVPRHGLFRSIAICFHTVIVTRQMLLDVGYLAMTTPVAAFSCYVCVLALRMLLRNGFYEIPWTIVAMLPTCLLTLIAYWRWIITLGRLHGHRWRRYWRNNFVVRLIPDNGDREVVDPLDATEHFEQWRFEEIEDYA